MEGGERGALNGLRDRRSDSIKQEERGKRRMACGEAN